MTREIFHSEKAPQAIGPYSQAVRSGNLVFLSGQVPLDPKTQQLVTGDIEAETRQVFANLRAVAEAAGSSLDNAVRVTIYLTDMSFFPKVNDVMASALAKPFPSRVTVGVAQLPRGARVEIECILAV